MIVLRPLGDVAVIATPFMNAVTPSLVSTLSRTSTARITAARQAVAISDPAAQRAITTAAQAVDALRPQCAEVCGADAKVAADPDAFARCVQICASTGDPALAARRARAGSFCSQVLTLAGSAIGPGTGTDYQHLYERCQDDPDAFLGELRQAGINIDASFEPWIKRNWKWLAIGGAAFFGLLVVRKLRR